MEQTPSRHRRHTPAPNQEPRVIIYIDQSNNSGNIATGSGIIQQLDRVTINGSHYGGIVSGTVNGDNHQEVTISRSSALEAELLAEIERLKKENARLMSITENMAERIHELRAGQAAPGEAKRKAGR